METLVLDVTKFLDEHPGGAQGGADAILRFATVTFDDDFEFTMQGNDARKMLTEYKIGVLPEVECVEQWEIPYPDDTSEEVEDPEVECVLPEVDPPSEEVEDPEVECVLPEVECVLPEMEMTKKDSKKKDGCGCAIMWSREKFRLQWEGTKNIFKSLFLAVGSYNFLLKPYLNNFRKFSNTPSENALC